MGKKIKYVFILSLFILTSCNKFDGKLSYRDASKYYGFYGTDEMVAVFDSKKVFLVNTSGSKKLKYTLKVTTKNYDCDYNSQEPKKETEKINEEQRFITLEPGEEKELNCNKYKLKHTKWDKYGRGVYDPSLHFYCYIEIDYEIVGAREDK